MLLYAREELRCREPAGANPVKRKRKNIFPVMPLMTGCIALVCSFAFFSCKKQIALTDPPDIPPPAGVKLVAEAGNDKSFYLPITSVLLDGSASIVPIGGTFNWSLISGPSAPVIAHPDSIRTWVNLLQVGVYRFMLSVGDNKGGSAKDSVTVTVKEPDPMVCDISNRPLINATLTEIGTLSLARKYLAAAVAGNKIVFAGGVTDFSYPPGVEGVELVDIYDLATNSWSTAQLHMPKYDMSVISSGNKIFFTPGWYTDGGTWMDPNKLVDVYDASNNIWSTVSLDMAKVGVTPAAVGSKVLFAGGYNGWTTGLWLSKVDIYDLAGNNWTSHNLSHGAQGYTAVTAGNKIYFAGGIGQGESFFNTIDVYDDLSNSWSVTSFQQPRAGVAAAAKGDYIYWGGGAVGNDLGNLTKRVEIRNIQTGNSTFECLSYARFCNAFVKGDDIVFFTGYPVSKTFDIYNTVTRSWSIGVLPAELWGAAVVCVNNRLYIGGGVWGANMNGSVTNKVYQLTW